MDRVTAKDTSDLADLLIKQHPDLFEPAERAFLAGLLADLCQRIVYGRDNDRRLETANRLIRMRDRGEPWSDTEEDQADLYGVAGPRRRVAVLFPNGKTIKLSLEDAEKMIAEWAP